MADLGKIQQRSTNDSLFKLGPGETVNRHSGSLSKLSGQLKRRDRLSKLRRAASVKDPIESADCCKKIFNAGANAESIRFAALLSVLIRHRLPPRTGLALGWRYRDRRAWCIRSVFQSEFLPQRRF